MFVWLCINCIVFMLFTKTTGITVRYKVCCFGPKIAFITPDEMIKVGLMDAETFKNVL